MVKQITHKELKTLLKHISNKEIKHTIFISGFRGIGKSESIEQTARANAEKEKREYVNFHKTTHEEKKEILSNPKKYYVFIDIRLSEYDIGDIKGLPIFNDDKKALEYKIELWALLLEHAESKGILFFDELNLSTPLVMSSCYKIIYDRIINNGKINDAWLIASGGNKTEERAFTHEIPKPLLDRCLEVELIPPSIDDFTEYASANNFDSRVISFLNFKTSNLFKISEDDDEQKDTTPRGWERVSNLIKGEDDLKTLDLLTTSAISEGIAKEFISFCRIKDKIDLNEILKNPQKIKALEDISVKYFLVSAIADKYKDEKIKFKSIVEVSKVFDEIKNAEFVTLLWKMCFLSNPKFKEDFLNEIDESLSVKYARFLK